MLLSCQDGNPNAYGLVVVAVAVPPVPVFLLVSRAALVEVLMVAVSIVFPILVVDNLSAPRVVVVIVGVIDPRMYRATSH